MAEGMATLRNAKKDLRAALRQRLSQVPADVIATQSRKIVDALFSMSEYQNARRISVYLSMPSGEVSTTSIVYDALERGKKVFVPYIHKLATPAPGGHKSVMQMVSLLSREDFESLTPDSWGIPTPSQGSIAGREVCLCHPEGPVDHHVASGEGDVSLDMIVMPGMAFDRDLNRLGHGKGFYDIFLKGYHERNVKGKSRHMPSLVGLGLKEQILPHGQNVPVDALDWRLDALVIGDGTIIS